jgi:hypothetical protein
MFKPLGAFLCQLHHKPANLMKKRNVVSGVDGDVPAAKGR